MRAALLGFLLASSASASDFVRVEGRVLDPVTHAPVAAAHVAIAEAGHASILFPTADDMMIVAPGESAAVLAHCSGEARTDGAGKFHIDELQPGRYSLVAAEAQRGIAIVDVRLDAQLTRSLEITLEQPRFLEVSVKGPAFDPSKHVLEFKPRVALDNVMLLPRLALGDGWNFKAGPLPAVGDWLVLGSELVLDNDYRATLFTWPVELAAPGTTRVEIDLQSGLDLAGVARGPSDEPLDGASVLVRSRAKPGLELGAVTDAKGRYAIHGCAPGAYELVVARWRMRDVPGCGQGPIDALATRAIELPLANASAADIKIESFERALAVGTLAPDFTAQQLDGTPLKLADLRGKIVLLDFWATWCGLCRADLPNLERYYPEHAKDGRFEIVSISVDDDPALVQRFLASRKLPWRQIALGPVKANPLAKLYNVWGTPATVLIDRDGVIAARNLLGDELRKKIDELLAAK
jgi:peroxiredoxin/protocatechuate 3,4-dioxygenase beta subunit